MLPPRATVHVTETQTPSHDLLSYWSRLSEKLKHYGRLNWNLVVLLIGYGNYILFSWPSQSTSSRYVCILPMTTPAETREDIFHCFSRNPGPFYRLDHLALRPKRCWIPYSWSGGCCELPHGSSARTGHNPTLPSHLFNPKDCFWFFWDKSLHTAKAGYF